MNKLIHLFLFFSFCLPSTAAALEQSLAGAYLQYPVGAQQSAMGGTGISYSSTACPFYNPALLTAVSPKTISFGSGVFSLGRLEGFLSGSTHISPRAAVGVTVLYRGDPYISDLYDIDENKAAVGSYTTITTKVSGSYLITRRLSAGATIGIFYQNLPTAINLNGTLATSDVTGVGGFDAGLLYRLSDKSNLGLSISNMAVNMEWQLGSEDALQATAANSVPPDIAAGFSTIFSLAQRPLLIACDVHGALTDGTMALLDRPEAELRLGAQWQVRDIFCVRAGLSDLPLNGDILRDWHGYTEVFAPAITAGFGLDAAKFRKGMKINYGLRTDKIGAGIDQLIDLSYSF